MAIKRKKGAILGSIIYCRMSTALNAENKINLLYTLVHLYLVTFPALQSHCQMYESRVKLDYHYKTHRRFH
jgi:hypothetical protein